MKSNPIFLLFLTLFMTGYTGCDRGRDAVDKEAPVSVVEVLSEEDKAALAEKLKSLDSVIRLPLEKRGEVAREHMLKYLELKDKESAAAIGELKIAFYILAKNYHPLMEEWLFLVPRVFGVDEGTLTDLLRLNEIELQIARDNDESPRYVKALEEQIEQFKAEIEDLRTHDINPEEFKVPFKAEEKK